jgi:hypothetical protein
MAAARALVVEGRRHAHIDERQCRPVLIDCGEQGVRIADPGDDLAHLQPGMARSRDPAHLERRHARRDQQHAVKAGAVGGGIRHRDVPQLDGSEGAPTMPTLMAFHHPRRGPGALQGSALEPTAP